MDSKNPIAVIGAGMVGTCCALYLQNEGFKVILVDRIGPGEAASSGNLGGFGIASCPPHSMPGILLKVPRMLLDPDAPLKLRWGHALIATPWFLRFIANSRRERIEANAKARQSLLDKSYDSIKPLVAEAGAESFLCQKGLMFTFESNEAYRSSAYAFDLRRRNGVQLDELDGDEARELEPGLSENVVGGLRVPYFMHTNHPLGLVRALAGLFEKRGGQIVSAGVYDFDIGVDGVRAMKTDTGELPVSGVVLAAGVWSGPLAAALGTKVPLEAERGYHTVFQGAEMTMNGAVISVDRNIAITPMTDGIRAGGVAEFATPEAPPNYKYSRMIQRHAEALFPTLKSENHSDWVGSRPSHPDSKPAIGRSPRHKNAYFAFGHDHLGLTMGGITGKLISELVAGKQPSLDLEPFRPDRF
jgi:D-amino-acid dehydrogenase